MSAPTNIAGARLADIVGSQNASFDPRELAAYEIGGLTPGGMARPGSGEEVAELVRMAAADRLAVIPCGARTKLEMGLAPERYDLAIDMTRLDRVAAYDPGDLTLGVEAGCGLAKLQSVLAEHRQFLPLAVPWLRRTTVGGTIATGVDTPLRQLFGTTRDYILGMEFVTGEGVAAKSGGRVVKNVTGYDLHKLMIGAFGSLGIITKINFRTFPLPLESRALVARFDESNGAFELRDRVAESALAPLTMEIFSPQVSELFSSDAAARLEPRPIVQGLLSPKHWAFASGFAGNEAVLGRYERDMSGMAQRCGAASVTVLSQEQIAGAFGRKREFVPIALESSPTTTILKLSVLPRKMKELAQDAGRFADRSGVRWVIMARGVGIIYFALLPEAIDEDARSRAATISEEVMAAVASLDGHATIPWCPREWRSSLPVWGRPRADFPQMAKLKTLFDPNRILAPGRFVGGL
ncbi:MAG: FAD-binding oxidoreductase [Candidatus Acidiferrales bacterium]